jgi:hypothetical protein
MHFSSPASICFVASDPLNRPSKTVTRLNRNRLNRRFIWSDLGLNFSTVGLVGFGFLARWKSKPTDCPALVLWRTTTNTTEAVRKGQPSPLVSDNTTSKKQNSQTKWHCVLLSSASFILWPPSFFDKWPRFFSLGTNWPLLLLTTLLEALISKQIITITFFFCWFNFSL